MSRFSKQDYEMVTSILRETRKSQLPHQAGNIVGLTLDVVILRFCAEFTMDNPAFQAEKFRAACDYEKESQDAMS
jgi:hypothetical protein